MDNRKWAADALATAPVAPAAPSNGYPTNGDPGSGQNATEPGAWWFHQIGEEIRAVIEGGGLVPSHTVLTQLLASIHAIIIGKFTAPNQLLSANGFQKLPGGLIIQWGKVVTSASEDVVFSYPIPFPNAVFAIIPGAAATGAGHFATHNGGTLTAVNISAWSSTTTRIATDSFVFLVGY